MRDRPAAWIPPAVGAVLGAVTMTSFDLPLMVACGERLLATGEIPRTNPFHWPHPDFAWLDDKWGFGLLTAAADRLGGGVALTLLNVLLGAVAGALLHALARRRAAPWTAAAVAAFGVTLLSYRSMLRAEWISALGIAWTLLQVDGVLAGSWRRAALVVAAMPLWAACHLYWFLGPALLVAAAAGAAIPGRNSAAASRRGAVLCLGTATAAFLAAGVSPYGWDNLAHPFRILAQLGSTELGEAIVELRAPFVSGGPFTAYHLLSAVAALLCVGRAGAAWTNGRRADALVTGLLVAVSLRFDRNLALLGVAAAFTPPRDDSTGPRRAASWQLWAACVVVAGHLAGISWFAPERRAGFGWDDRAFPTALAAREPLRGTRFVNDLSIGSWLDREAGSSFIDGNTHGWPREHFTLYRSLLDGSAPIDAANARWPNDGWFLRTSAPHTRVLVVGLLLEGDYAPVAHDAVATLFRPVPDPEEADRLWKSWLGGVYLPVARDWFPAPVDAQGRPLSDPDPLDVAAWRARVVRCPWDRRALEGLQAAYDRRREPLRAARIWRVLRRLGD